MTYSIHYFDGKSSKKHAGDLTLHANFWCIEYTDSQNKKIKILWNTKEIIPSEVYSEGIISFKYGTFPFQTIESNDENLINYIQESNSFTKVQNRFDSLLHKSRIKTIFLLCLFIVSFAVFTFTYIIPKVSEFFITNLSKEYVTHFGNSVFNSLSVGLDIDQDKTEKLQNFTDALKINCSFPIKIHVATNNQINAFAVSGGKIVIYSGLLEKLETEAQLAALISHEITHIEKRHALKNVSRNLSGMIFLSILIGDVSGITAVFFENAYLFKELSYSRELEKEADINGIEILKKNQLDLNGMPQLFTILKNETNFEITSYLSNHPALDERIEYTTSIAKTYKTTPKTNSALKGKWKAIQSTFKN